ncbi:signal peptidase I [Halotia branconii]|uniref:Signal peptidase I n=1 Tax=Halotia branconii CENA392 TaxID=1539056 RepID=A0AAJ6PA43_9CYAN|nr:signal peptidase I [Halotia branconii]WGV26352.1 signal peptidase I [Halotia branconii CENA392]
MKKSGALLITIAILGLLLQGCNKYKVYWMPSEAMLPNVQTKDKLLVDTSSYYSQVPQRYDLVLFSPTEQLKTEQYSDPFIKRVVGLPGEKIEIKDGKIYINNQSIQENYILNGQKTLVDICPLEYTPYLSKPVTIPSNSYFMLGDNREKSYDSRCWGIVPKNNLIGKVVKILKY